MMAGDFPDHKRAIAFAKKVHRDENPDVANLGCAYVEAVLELKRAHDALDTIERRVNSADTGPLRLSDYLDLSSKRRRKRRA